MFSWSASATSKVNRCYLVEGSLLLHRVQQYTNLFRATFSGMVFFVFDRYKYQFMSVKIAQDAVVLFMMYILENRFVCLASATNKSACVAVHIQHFSAFFLCEPFMRDLWWRLSVLLISGFGSLWTAAMFHWIWIWMLSSRIIGGFCHMQDEFQPTMCIHVLNMNYLVSLLEKVQWWGMLCEHACELHTGNGAPQLLPDEELDERCVAGKVLLHPVVDETVVEDFKNFQVPQVHTEVVVLAMFQFQRGSVSSLVYEQCIAGGTIHHCFQFSVCECFLIIFSVWFVRPQSPRKLPVFFILNHNCASRFSI